VDVRRIEQDDQASMLLDGRIDIGYVRLPISFLPRSATVFYSHPDVAYVPVLDLAPDQVCLAMAASNASPLAEDFFAAVLSTAEITAECGNYEMWQLGGEAAAQQDALVE